MFPWWEPLVAYRGELGPMQGVPLRSSVGSPPVGFAWRGPPGRGSIEGFPWRGHLDGCHWRWSPLDGPIAGYPQVGILGVPWRGSTKGPWVDILEGDPMQGSRGGIRLKGDLWEGLPRRKSTGSGPLEMVPGGNTIEVSHGWGHLEGFQFRRSPGWGPVEEVP